MDSASESLVFETVDENEVTISSNSFPHVINELGAEGSVVSDAALAAASSSGERDVKAVEPGSTPQSSSAAGDTFSTRKGHGLKKWRRIRRDVAKDVTASTDCNKILKRVLPNQANSENPSSKPQHSAGNLHNTDTSVGSASGLQFDGVGDGNLDHGSPISSIFAVAPTFVAGVDSDNSEDRSSKSSTAASAPRFGYAAEKNRVINFSGKSLSNSMQGKSRIESSKKARGGERIKIEKENSHSSVESDSRSSNFVFMQAPFSRNGTKNGTSRDYENEGHFCGEGQTSYSKGNAEDSEGHSRGDSGADIPWKTKMERHENHHQSKDHDPLLSSIASLSSVQESLEKELQKLAEIGKEPLSPHFSDSQTSPDSLETQVLTLTEHVCHLESVLEETRTALHVKESQLSKLEASLNTPRKEKSSFEIDEELETLFQQRIESEVEFLTLKSTIQSLKTDEQDTLQNLKKRLDIDGLSGDMDEVLRFQKGTWKVSGYFLLQLVLLGFVVCLFVLRVSLEPTFSVPT